MTLPSPELDAAVREWFASHGLAVHSTHEDFDHDFFAWRHTGDRRHLTLWISETTIEDYEPKTIIWSLRDFEPNALMETFGHAHLHVNSNEVEFGAYVRDDFSPSAA
jgi:hypothetical protein